MHGKPGNAAGFGNPGSAIIQAALNRSPLLNQTTRVSARPMPGLIAIVVIRCDLGKGEAVEGDVALYVISQMIHAPIDIIRPVEADCVFELDFAIVAHAGVGHFREIRAITCEFGSHAASPLLVAIGVVIDQKIAPAHIAGPGPFGCRRGVAGAIDHQWPHVVYHGAIEVHIGIETDGLAP